MYCKTRLDLKADSSSDYKDLNFESFEDRIERAKNRSGCSMMY
jgi:hypothetical protein